TSAKGAEITVNPVVLMSAWHYADRAAYRIFPRAVAGPTVGDAPRTALRGERGSRLLGIADHRHDHRYCTIDADWRTHPEELVPGSCYARGACSFSSATALHSNI